MNRYSGLALCALFLHAGATQASDLDATTADGRKVILRNDGTWIFPEAATAATRGLTSKPMGASQVLRSKKGFMELWYDPAKWLPRSTKMNESAEFVLEHTAGDAFALAIIERIAMPFDSLRNFALENARSQSPDARITLEEQRTVNGISLNVLKIDGTMNGIAFRYYGYYWSGKAGTMQVITFTAQNLFDEIADDFTGLLNGIVITKE